MAFEHRTTALYQSHLCPNTVKARAPETPALVSTVSNAAAPARGTAKKDDDDVALCEAVSRGEMTQEAAAEALARRWPCHQ
jgi:hypothetical protein